MIGRLVLAFIAWRLLRRLLLGTILVALVVSALHALPEPRTHRRHPRQTTIERLLAPIERDISHAIGSGR